MSLLGQRLAELKLTREQVAGALGIAPPAVLRPVGEQTRAAIPPDVRLRVRQLHAAGRSQKDIARLTGVARGSVWNLTR